MDPTQMFERYRAYLCTAPEIGLRLDVSRMGFPDGFLDSLQEPMARAFAAMKDLEDGGLANPDENRMVGHYWLRDPERSPGPVITGAILQNIEQIKQFAAEVHAGDITPPSQSGFHFLLLVGIGGSALGPQFVADALGGPEDAMTPFFLDNTDPDGIDRVLGDLESLLDQTLTIVISKSGGTKETRNGMLEVEAAYAAAGLEFAKHAVAVTGEGSELHQRATKEDWIRTFPMWDWVGGRTSVLSGVGLLPSALMGYDVEAMLTGARECDAATRVPDLSANPAALMAAMWHYASGGAGRRDLVVLPYSDRLALFGKYLQQLVMESLGKKLDRGGREVFQGLTVYGNKGSTDQHAYVQQLRDGVINFFVTFIEVLRKRDHRSIEVDPGVSTGDYLHGFLHGTRQALAEAGRESMTITVEEMGPRTVGALIALFERTVGLYAELIDINAYHQPGVEAGKKAAAAILALQARVLAHLRSQPGTSLTAGEVAEGIGADDVEAVHHLLCHLAANDDHGVSCDPSEHPADARYSA